ncbi:hypothetical protein HWV07_15225 [Natronomonas salina]|uniref:hypothetical protein n=1 Tax=Natronomonas salina TaxID=1710540 RepID=UPI0015B760F2|nr:hypothetical protein [Natronomonas salina]QLD90313.1 hypothetical protein HWV07_15225 [Natronomonas salina]
MSHEAMDPPAVRRGDHASDDGAVSDSLAEETTRLASTLATVYRGSVTVDVEDASPSDRYLRITPADARSTSVLETVEAHLRDIEAQSPECFLYKSRDDKLYVKLVEDSENFDDSAWMWV